MISSAGQTKMSGLRFFVIFPDIFSNDLIPTLVIETWFISVFYKACTTPPKSFPVSCGLV